MFGDYKVIDIIGYPVGHEKWFTFVERVLSSKGFICLTPPFYNYNLYNEYKSTIENMNHEKLKICDICVIVTPFDDNKSLIDQAKSMGKPCYVLCNDNLILIDDFLNSSDEDNKKYSPLTLYHYYNYGGDNDTSRYISRDLWRA